MKVENEIVQFIIRIIFCILIKNARGTEIIESILDDRSNFLSNILSPEDPISKSDFLEESAKSRNSLRIKPLLRINDNLDDFSNEDSNYQDNIINSLENWKEIKGPQKITKIHRQREIDNYEQLEDVSETKNIGSNLQENFNIAEDASRMISVIGSLEDTDEHPIDDLQFGKIGKGQTNIIPMNKDNKNETLLNRILTKVNNKFKKVISSTSENYSAFSNRVQVNVAINASEMKNVVQTLTMTKNKKRIINPHLGEKKSFFKYKQALKRAAKFSLNETTSENSLKKVYGKNL